VLELLDPLSIAAASSHFDVNVDSDDDNDVYDPIGIKHYVKVNIVYYLLILTIFGTFFWTFCSRHFVFSKLDFGFLISDLKNPYTECPRTRAPEKTDKCRQQSRF
jgi:hypothetical protein